MNELPVPPPCPAPGASGRRRFLSTLLGCTVAVALPRPVAPRGPAERPLREADYYRPHRLAG